MFSVTTHLFIVKTVGQNGKQQPSVPSVLDLQYLLCSIELSSIPTLQTNHCVPPPVFSIFTSE